VISSILSFEIVNNLSVMQVFNFHIWKLQRSVCSLLLFLLLHQFFCLVFIIFICDKLFVALFSSVLLVCFTVIYFLLGVLLVCKQRNWLEEHTKKILFVTRGTKGANYDNTQKKSITCIIGLFHKSMQHLCVSIVCFFLFTFITLLL